MSDPAREELAELTRLLVTHTAWLRELGGSELPLRGELPGFGAVDVPAVPAARVSEPAPEPVVEARPQPSTPVSPVAPVAPPAPAPVAPAPAPSVQTPAWNELNAPAAKPVVVEPPKRVVAPAVRALFAEFEPPAPAAASAARGQAPVVKVKSPPLEGPARIRALEVIQEEVRGCTRCGLAAKRHNTVFARGNPMARLAFVGEGPGEQEDLQGLPFVGRAGQLLDRIVMGMGLTQDDIYVCNVVKCRPPGNRVPEPDEMTTCGPYLSAQLDLVRPEVIVVLGLTAARYLLKTKSPMSKLRGQWQNYEDIAVMPTWHPAYVLRDMDRPNSTARREVWEDMKLVLAKLGLPVPQK